MEQKTHYFSSFVPTNIVGFDIYIFDPYSPKILEEAYHLEITSAAVLVLVNFENERWILLTQQADREGNPWEIPSGKVDRALDKNPIDTARRELREETDIEAIELKPLTYCQKPRTKNAGMQFYTEITLDNLKIVRREGEHIYLEVPAGVDRNEIAALCLEKYNLLGKSLLHSSAHSWAYRPTFGALAQRLES